MQIINRGGFQDMGFPYYGWLIAIYSAVIKVAYNFNIPLIIYGEDGEIEYGGSIENKNKAINIYKEFFILILALLLKI